MSVSESLGSEVEALRASAETLAAAIDRCDSDRELAGLVRELRQVLGRIAEVEGSTVGGSTKLDELARRRAERLAAAEG